jgi:hypothetical protein
LEDAVFARPTRSVLLFSALLLACGVAEAPADVAARFCQALNSRNAAAMQALSSSREPPPGLDVFFDEAFAQGHFSVVGQARREGELAVVETQLYQEPDRLPFDTYLIGERGEWLVLPVLTLLSLYVAQAEDLVERLPEQQRQTDAALLALEREGDPESFDRILELRKEMEGYQAQFGQAAAVLREQHATLLGRYTGSAERE